MKILSVWLVAFGISLSSAFAVSQNSSTHRSFPDPIDVSLTLRSAPILIERACKEAFRYSFQQEDCIRIAKNADQVRGCALFAADFRKMDCIKEARATFGGVWACYQAFDLDFKRFDCLRLPVTGDTVSGCALFTHDFQKFDCFREARARRGGVRACIQTFRHDFQRFECLRLPVSGEIVRACAEKSQHDFQIFDCLKR